MKQPEIHVEAISRFYGAQLCVLIGESVFQKLSQQLPKNLEAFCLSADSVITPQDDADKNGTVPMQGSSNNIISVIVGPAERSAADSIVAHAALHGAHKTPQLLECKSGIFGGFDMTEALSFVMESMVSNVEKVQIHSADTVRELVALRESYEKQALEYQKAKKLIRNVEADAINIVMDLSPCAETLSQPIGEDTFIFSQILPTDLVSFAGIWLYVADVPESNEGILHLTIRRAADKMVIANISQSYAVIQAGWSRFVFDPYFPVGTGDIELSLTWCGVNGPAFAMADAQTIGFGDQGHRSLALRIETGFADACRNLPHSGLAGWRHINGSDLVDNAIWIDCSKSEQDDSGDSGKSGYKAVWDDECFSMQVQAGRLMGVYSANRLPTGTSRCSLKVCLPRARSGPCIFLVAQIPATVVSEDIGGYAISFLAEAASAGIDDASGITWSKTLVSGSETTKIHLELDEEVKAPSGLFMAVQPLESTLDYVVSKWLSLEWFVNEKVTSVVKAAPAYPPTGGKKLLIRSYKFTELLYDLNYYAGKETLERISKELGYSPFLLDGEGDVLQTHPYKGHASVAILSGGAVGTFKRVICDVATAHPAASDFFYVLGAVPSDKSNKVALIDQVMASVKNGNLSGADKKLGVEWNALLLKPLQKIQLGLELKHLAGTDCDLFFGALQHGEEANFAWCRWYSLLVESEAEATTASLLNAHESLEIVDGNK